MTTSFKRNALASLGALIAMASATSALAAPLIIATSVTSNCKVEEDNSVSTVAVTLNTVTASFYGSGLFYHFTPASGTTQSFPSPSGSPKTFALAAGTYSLTITTNISPTYAGASGSPAYSVTVPTFKVLTMRGRKVCVVAKKLDLNPRDAIKKF